MKAAVTALTLILLPAASHAAGKLRLDDRASVWPSAGMNEKIDFTNRMGKSMGKLAPELDNHYFMRCLEETANIGDTKELTLSDMIKTCVSLKMSKSSDHE